MIYVVLAAILSPLVLNYALLWFWPFREADHFGSSSMGE